MDTIKVKVRIAIVAIFLVGFASGALSARLFYPSDTSAGNREPRSRESHKQKLMSFYGDNLHMSQEQRNEMSKILDETAESMNQLRLESKSRHDAVIQNARARIRLLLTPDQQIKYDQLVREYDAQRQKNRHR